MTDIKTVYCGLEMYNSIPHREYKDDEGTPYKIALGCKFVVAEKKDE